MADLSYAEISKLLKYDAETGKLYWLPRPTQIFRSSPELSQEANAKAWNTRYAGKQAFLADLAGYFSGRVFKRLYRAHRVAWVLHYGVWPSGQIDHINGDRTDNRIINLRDVTSSENRKNQRLRSNSKSGVCGVYWDASREKWCAHIGTKHLGRFKDKDEAIACRKQAEKDHGYHENHGRL